MPYVQRNERAEVVGLLKEPTDSAREFLVSSHPDVVAFLLDRQPGRDGPDGREEGFSLLADLEMVRVIEDLVDLLISKNVIVLTDLPEAVQDKLLRQRNLRSALFGGISLNDEEGKGLF